MIVMPRAYEVIIGTDVPGNVPLAVADATRQLSPIHIDGIIDVNVYGDDDPDQLIGVGLQIVTEESQGRLLDCGAEIADEIPVPGEVYA